jgi:polyphosphate kinase 2 (PPK2 family)
VAHLPAGGEFVLFNRSWYNRAGVEHVMEFCTEAEYESFMASVPLFEDLLVRSGIRLFKYYLDIRRDEQKRRLAARERDPLKQWKVSPIDKTALKHWKAYSRARDAMLSRSHSAAAPWIVVRADDKKLARLNLIRDLLSRLEYDGKAKPSLLAPDRRIVFSFDAEALRDGRLAA